MRIFPRGNVYWYRFKHRGVDVEGSTRVRIVDGEIAARNAAVIAQADHIRQAGPGGKGHAEIVSLAALEELDMQRAESEGARKDREKDLEGIWKHIHRHFGEHRDVATLTLDDLQNYEKARRAEGDAGQTIVRERQALVRGLRKATTNGLLDRMPFDATLLSRVRRSPKNKRQKGVLHSIGHIEHVLAHLSAKARTVGHYATCRYVMKTGLRSSELACAGTFQVTPRSWPVRDANGQTIWIKGGVLHVRSSKETTEITDERDIPLDSEAWRIHQKWSYRFHKMDIAHSLERASEKAGVARGVTLRDLRKFFISRVAKSDLPAAQRLAGHASVATTALYVDAEQEEALEVGFSAVSNLPGGQKGGQQKKTAEKTQ